jgi:hypothetical protein
MVGSNTLFFSSKFLRVGQILSSKFIDNLAPRPPKFSPALVLALPVSVHNVPTEPS